MDYEQKYEQKYREALGWMRSLYDGLHGATKEDAEHYFPELKENKSERVRKGLIKTVSSLLDNTILYHTDITKEEALAWLEKQGEQTHAELGQSEATKTSDQELYYDIANFKEGMPVLVRDGNDEEWNYLLFSHYRKKLSEHFFAGGTPWSQCVPFNEKTKYLLGTTDMCPEEYINQ